MGMMQDVRRDAETIHGKRDDEYSTRLIGDVDTEVTSKEQSSSVLNCVANCLGNLARLQMFSPPLRPVDLSVTTADFGQAGKKPAFRPGTPVAYIVCALVPVMWLGPP